MKQIFMFALLIVMCGCASQRYGMFTEAKATSIDRITDDSVNELVIHYKPAKSHLIIREHHQDAFGKSLIAKMRKRGYSITECNDYQACEELQKSDKTLVTLNYVLDRQSDSELMRVLLNVGTESLARAYSDDMAAGPWDYRRGYEQKN